MQARCLVVVALMLIISWCAEAAILKKDPTFLIVAPTMVRPNSIMTISANILKLESDSFTVSATVRRLNDGKYEEICGIIQTLYRPGTYDIKMKTREKMTPGNYTLRVAGYSDPNLQGQIFLNDTELFFDPRQVAVFIQTSKPFYRQGQTVRFRVIPVKPNLMSVSTTMDVRIKDPNGYVVRQFYAQHTNAGGVVSLSYPLNSNRLVFGDWTIEVYCYEHTYNTTFRVQEFWPPLFYVNVSMPTYMVRNMFGISGIVTSNHTTNRGTKGEAIIRLDILTMADENTQPYEPLYRNISYFDSRADFLFTREEMEVRAGGPTSLIGKELRVTAYVKDWFYNTTAIGYQSCVVYDEDVELKFLGGQVWTFKPELPFQVHIAAVKRDGTPLDPWNENRTINLIIEETSEVSGTKSRSDEIRISEQTSIASYWLYPSATTSRISIVARYRNKEDTRRELVASKYWSPNKYYIQLSSPTKYPSVGGYVIFDVKTNTFIDRVFYHIIAAGNIIVSDTLPMYSRSKLFAVACSRDMAPTATIIVYYVAMDGQVITDSLNFHVNSTGLHQMHVRFNRGKDLTYETAEINVTANPLSYVAFSAIEYQLYELGARNGLIWDQIYKELYTFQGKANTSSMHAWLREGQIDSAYYASTPSFAHDANTTFFYSGLYVFTDANASAVFTLCNKTRGEWPCMDGKSCYDTRQACTWKYECSSDHKDEMGCPANETFKVNLYNKDPLWRTRHIGLYHLDGSFLWQDQFTKPDGRIDIRFDVPTWPTTWVVSGFAMSRENGLAILPRPVLFDGVRPMYISIEGPSYAMIGEHISLRVSIFNYWEEVLDVLLTVEKSSDFQFVSVKRDSASTDPSEPVDGTQQILVPVFPGHNRQVMLPIVPRKFGYVAIPVTASCFVSGHSVNHWVHVQHYGIREHYVTSYQADLRISNAQTLPDLFIPVEEQYITPEQRIQNYVPGSPLTKVYVQGDILGMTFFPYTDYGITAEDVLYQPYASGSEAVFNFAINVITLKMLRALSSVSVEKIEKVTNTLNLKLQDMLFYMRGDGSFIEFRWSEVPSVWLTATALQALADGREGTSDLYLDYQVPPFAISQAAHWLTEQQDPVTGAFKETSYMYNRRYQSQSTVTAANGQTVPSNVSLTALCLIALNSAVDLDENAAKAVMDAKLKAGTYLSNQVAKLTDPFEIAITAYALQKGQSQAAAILAIDKLKRSARQVKTMMYWSTQDIPEISKNSTGLDTTQRLGTKQFSDVTAYAVATTSYAMLAYMESNMDTTLIDYMQKFLQEQHMWIGGFSSTEDTLIAVKALKSLAEKNQDRVMYAMTFEFRSDQKPNWTRALTIDQTNWFDLHTIDLPSHWGSIKTAVRGHGVALVQMETFKNHEHKEQLRKPSNGKITYLLGQYNDNIRTRGFNHSYIDYALCPQWVGDSTRSGFTVLEVGIPSGFVVHNDTLKDYVKNQRATSNSTLRNAEFYDAKAVFYFDYLDGTSDTNCARFSAFRWYPVANISENQFIKIFEYYEPGNFNYTLYEKVELRTLTVCLVCGSYQCPYCPHFASSMSISPSVFIIIFCATVSLFLNFNGLSDNRKRWLSRDCC